MSEIRPVLTTVQRSKAECELEIPEEENLIVTASPMHKELKLHAVTCSTDVVLSLPAFPF